MNRDIYNLAEWSEDDLKNVRNKIVLELDNRRNAKEYKLREDVRTALLRYADFLDTNDLDKNIGTLIEPLPIGRLIELFTN